MAYSSSLGVLESISRKCGFEGSVVVDSQV